MVKISEFSEKVTWEVFQKSDDLACLFYFFVLFYAVSTVKLQKRTSVTLCIRKNGQPLSVKTMTSRYVDDIIVCSIVTVKFLSKLSTESKSKLTD